MIRVLGVFIVSFALALSVPLAANERIGLIKVLWGTAVIKRGGIEVPAQPGEPLFVNDVIETAEESAVGMTFTDNSRVSLGAKSVFSVEEYIFSRPGQDNSFEAKLDRGSLTAASGKIARSRPLSMRILTPTTVLGVKGTEFALRVGEE